MDKFHLLLYATLKCINLSGEKRIYIQILKNKRFVQWMKRNVDGKSFWEKKTDDKISIKINNNRIKVPTMRFKLAHWNWYVLFICADWLCVWALFSFALPFSMCVLFYDKLILNSTFIRLFWNSRDSNKVRSEQSSYSQKVNRAHISDSDKGTDQIGFDK